mmetsp:Transcript_16447/g.35803  ORF Transcript_16447/g.35803 Transcript_16447/m.35803 type:complete len:219 (-) Transcript_16447:1046-1702(-)
MTILFSNVLTILPMRDGGDARATPALLVLLLLPPPDDDNGGGGGGFSEIFRLFSNIFAVLPTTDDDEHLGLFLLCLMPFAETTLSIGLLLLLLLLLPDDDEDSCRSQELDSSKQFLPLLLSNCSFFSSSFAVVPPPIAHECDGSPRPVALAPPPPVVASRLPGLIRIACGLLSFAPTTGRPTKLGLLAQLVLFFSNFSAIFPIADDRGGGTFWFRLAE